MKKENENRHRIFSLIQNEKREKRTTYKQKLQFK